VRGRYENDEESKMTKIFNLNYLNPETRAALKALERLANSPIEICESITVTVDSDEMSMIVEQLLGNMVATATTGRKSSIDVRRCEHCKQEYTPIRSDQKFCTNPECKKGRQRIYKSAFRNSQKKDEGEGETTEEHIPFPSNRLK
jgi:protein-arginine kinase activator protein McsA